MMQQTDSDDLVDDDDDDDRGAITDPLYGNQSSHHSYIIAQPY